MKIWTIVNRIVIVLTGVWAIIAICIFICNSLNDRIEAKIYSHEILISPTQEKYKVQIEERVKYNNIQKTVEEHLENSDILKINKYDKIVLVNDLTESIIKNIYDPLQLSSIYSDIWNNYPEYKNLHNIKIENRGKNKINDIKVIFPVSGEYKLIINKDIFKTGEFLGELEISELYPDQKIEVWIWSKDYFYSSLRDDSIITYENGSIKIKHGEYIYGLYLIIYRYFPIIIPIIALIILTLLLMRSKKSTENFKDDNDNDDKKEIEEEQT